MTANEEIVNLCPFCGSERIQKKGDYWECHDCKYVFEITEPVRTVGGGGVPEIFIIRQPLFDKECLTIPQSLFDGMEDGGCIRETDEEHNIDKVECEDNYIENGMGE